MSGAKDKTLYEQYADTYKAYLRARDYAQSKENELISATEAKRAAKWAYDDARSFLEAHLEGRLDHFGKPVEPSNAN